MSKREIFDVCVIGTGAGGGVMLQELCAAGLEVVALERGPKLDASHFVSDDELSIVVRDELFSPEQVETWRPDENTPTETGRFNMFAHCVGGTMTHWAAWSWRFLPDDFEVLSKEGPVAGASLADWPIRYEELEPFYERAESDFGVSGDAKSNAFAPKPKRAYPNPPHPLRRGSEIFSAAAKKIGKTPFPVPMAINSRAYAGRPQCVYGGACQQYGCPIHAKATTLSVCIPKALATGKLDLRTRARALAIETEKDGSARSVRYLDAEGNEQEVFARQFVVSCNTVGTPHLLHMSNSGRFPDGLANASGQMGRNLTYHVGDLVNFLVDEPTRSFTGLETHLAIDDWHASDPKRGFIRGGVVADMNMQTKQPITYALASAAGHPKAGRGWGADFKDFLRDAPRTVGLVAILEDLPMESNTVDLDPDVKDVHGLPAPRLTHRNHPNDLAMVRWYRQRMLELADAAGAKTAWPLVSPLSLVDETSALKGSGHFHGTCRMGDDPQRSVVDRWCRAHDVPNLWVVDSSVLPTSAGYNPTLTIVANAYRVADHFVREAKRGSL
ncbi:MAG: GMC family oxidoreductase [bacterium]|nr:GMC family oxidoreductase [bacterium]